MEVTDPEQEYEVVKYQYLLSASSIVNSEVLGNNRQLLKINLLVTWSHS